MFMRLLKSIDAFLTDLLGGLVARWFMGSFGSNLPELPAGATAGSEPAGPIQCDAMKDPSSSAYPWPNMHPFNAFWGTRYSGDYRNPFDQV